MFKIILNKKEIVFTQQFKTLKTLVLSSMIFIFCQMRIQNRSSLFICVNELGIGMVHPKHVYTVHGPEIPELCMCVAHISKQMKIPIL